MKNGKISKKFLSVLLSLCMVFTCTAPVFADSSAETERKELSKWTFDSQAEVDALVCDGGISKTLSEDGMLKIEGGAFPYIYPFDGLSLIVGKEYLVCFDAKAVDADTSSVILESHKNFGQQFAPINTETTSHFEYQFTAKSSETPNLVPLNGIAAKVYYDNIYLYEVTTPASIVASTPAAGDTVYPTNKIEIEFSDELSKDALAASSWTLTDGNGDTIAVSSVEKSGNKYTLNLAVTTKNMMSYKLSFDGLKTAYNQPLVTTSLDFISYEGETILYFPFSSAETSTWLYFQNGTDDFYNTDEYYSAPGSRWFNILPGVEVYVKKGDGNDANPPLIQGEEYIVSFRAKPYVENGEDASNVNILRLNEGDRQFAGSWSFSGTDWQFFTSTFTQLGGGSLRFQFDRKDASLPVKMYVDDFKITRKVPLADFEIVNSNPANESTVGIVDSITVDFANTPGATAANTANYTLSGGTQTVTGAKIIDNSVIVTFSEPLTENTAYKLTMNIKDVAGRKLVGRNTISFKTIANVLYKNYLSSDDDFNRPAFKEDATKEGNVALFNMSNEMDIYPFQNSSYVNTPLEKGKSYTIKFKAATTAEGNAKNFALVESDNSRFVDLIDDLSTEMKTYTVNFTAQTEKAPFFRMYTSDQSSSAKLLLDDIVLYTVPENEVYFEEVKLFANYGTDAQYQIFGDKIVDGDVSVVIEKGANCTGTEQNIMLMIAVYENNVLKNVVCDDLSLANNDIIKDPMRASITVPAQTEGVTRTLKAFVWNANNYSPYVDNIELKD